MIAAGRPSSPATSRLTEPSSPPWRPPAFIAAPRVRHAIHCGRTCASTKLAPRPKPPGSPMQTLQTECGAGEREHAERIAASCRLIETAETPPSLDALAAHAGLSPYHFHRVFKAATGVTPKAYAIAHRRSASASVERRQVRDHSHLRGRLQFQRALLRRRDTVAGHEAGDIPCWRRRRGNPPCDG